MPEKYLRIHLQNLVQYLLAALIALAPLKFGVMLMPGVPHGAGSSLWDWVLTGFPAAYFAVISSLLLLLALAAFGVPRTRIFCKRDGKILAMWFLLPLVALIGFINCDSYESGVLQFEYLLALAAFAGAVTITLHGTGGKFKTMLLAALAIGTLMTALWGVHQYFIGFEEMKNFIAEQEKNGVVIHPHIKARALDNRTYATFTFASALAGMFCLTGLLTITGAFKLGRYFEPIKVSQWALASVTLLLCGGIFLTTKGRGAFLAVIAAMAVAGVLMIKSRKLKWSIVAVAVLMVIGGAFYIHYAGRGFASMSERVGYLKSSWEMFAAHPFCGDGWGDFTYHHALHKNFGNEELAKDPHNILAAFASQAGIAGGTMIALIMFYSLYAAYRQLKNDFSWERLAVFFGLTAFALHALMDLDWQVPALMMWYIAVMLIGAYELPEAGKTAESSSRGRMVELVISSLVGVMALLGALHWSIADQKYSDFLTAAGQVPGLPQQPKAAAKVNQLARETLQWMPYSHSVYMSWGIDAMRRYNIMEAEERFNTVLQMVPRSHAAYERLGDLYKIAGNPIRSQECYQQADRLFPYKKIFEEQQRAAGSK